MSSKRFRLFVFFVRIWRACECPRLIFPVAVNRTRLAVPLCVFSFGIITPKYFQFPFTSSLPTLEISLSSIDSSPIGVGVNMFCPAIISYSAPLDGSGAGSDLGAAGSLLTTAGAALGVAGSDFPAVLCRFGPRIINI